MDGSQGWQLHRIELHQGLLLPKGRGLHRPTPSFETIAALSWGHGINDTAVRLMDESIKARENGARYA